MAKERTEYRHRTAARTDSLTGSSTAAASSSRPRRRSAGRLDLSRPRCCCSISTISRRSTTASATPSATGCCRSSPTPPRPISAPAGLVGRWGGDEFVAVLYDTARDAPRRWRSASRPRSRRRPRTSTATRSRRRSASAWCSAPSGPLDLPALLVQADQALYRAKSDGRNRLAVATTETAAKSGQGVPTPDAAPLDRRSAA